MAHVLISLSEVAESLALGAVTDILLEVTRALSFYYVWLLALSCVTVPLLAAVKWPFLVLPLGLLSTLAATQQRSSLQELDAIYNYYGMRQWQPSLLFMSCRALQPCSLPPRTKYTLVFHLGRLASA